MTAEADRRADARSTLIALDVDGVLNALTRSSKGRRGLMRTEIGGYPIQWRPEVIERLKSVLLRPGVEAAWLTTWLSEPALLDELVDALGLRGPDGAELVVHRALYPCTETAVDDKFGTEEADLAPGTARWWKFAAARELHERLAPARFAWIDDDLGRSKGVPGDVWRPQESHSTLLIRTNRVAGLLHQDVDRLEAWVAAGRYTPGPELG